MSVRIRYSMKVQISSDPTTEDKDLGNLSYEVVSDALGEGGARKFTIAGGATDVPLSMGNVAIGVFVTIRTTTKDPLEDPVPITIRVVRGLLSATEMVVPLSTTKEGHLLLSTSGVTELYATNAGAVAMDLVLAVAGD